jgi:translation initiation factor IF-2
LTSTGKLTALKHFKTDVDMVAEGKECGLSFDAFADVEPGDVIKCFERRIKARKLV